MKTLLFAFLTVLVAWPASAQQISEHLRPLAPYVGKTWVGEFANSTPDNPVVDVSKWEWALNGRAIRILHSVNDGEYGGETIIMYSEEEDALLGYYFTTAGFMTRAAIDVREGTFTSHELVDGHDGGITEVMATAILNEEGNLVSSSRYLRNGEWEEGHSITYRESPTAEVRFREIDVDRRK